MQQQQQQRSSETRSLTSAKRAVPDRAMVPRLSRSSCLVMPMPESLHIAFTPIEEQSCSSTTQDWLEAVE